MDENNEFKWLAIFFLLCAFSMGFLLAKTIYDDRPITIEELNDETIIQKFLKRIKNSINKFKKHYELHRKTSKIYFK